MQTFLPYASFRKSAECLDRQRLGKQRVEVLQILRALDDPDNGWASHPAVKMWRGYESALAAYGLYCCQVWTMRGYEDNCAEQIVEWYNPLDTDEPPWLGNEDFHRAHQSNLVRKDPDHYRDYFPNAPDDLDYVWPRTAANR